MLDGSSLVNGIQANTNYISKDHTFLLKFIVSRTANIHY